MSCATQTHSSTTAGPTLAGLTAKATKRLLKQSRHRQAAKESDSKRHLDDISPNLISDCEHADPECVWGDEGRVSD